MNVSDVVDRTADGIDQSRTAANGIVLVGHLGDVTELYRDLEA